MTQQGAAGRISEWDRIELGPEGTEADVSPAQILSVPDLMARWRRIAQDLDPTRLADLAEQIDAHLAAPASIHGIDTASISGDAIQGILDDLVPGTPPALPSTYALFFEPAESFSGVTYTGGDTDRYITNASGRLVRSSSSGVPVDYGVTGAPLVPIFPERVCHWTRSQANHSSLLSGTSGNQRIQNTGSTNGTTNAGATAIRTPEDTSTPSAEVLHVLATTDDSAHGITIERVDVYAASTVTTVSFYVYKGTRRYITLDIQNNTTGQTLLTSTPVIDLEDREIQTTSDEVRVHLHPHPSGWLRVGVTFAHVGAANNSFDLLIHGHDAPDTTSFTGTSGERLFSVFGINATRGEGLAPYMETTGAVRTASASSLTFNMSSALIAARGMMALSWIGGGNGLVTSGNAFGETLLKLNDATEIFVVTADGVKTVVANTDVLDNAPIPHGGSHTHAISWETGDVTSRTTGNRAKTNNAGLSITGTLTTTTIGPAPGYLKSFLLYPVPGDGAVLDYLLGEKEPAE